MVEQIGQAMAHTRGVEKFGLQSRAQAVHVQHYHTSQASAGHHVVQHQRACLNDRCGIWMILAALPTADQSMKEALSIDFKSG